MQRELKKCYWSIPQSATSSKYPASVASHAPSHGLPPLQGHRGTSAANSHKHSINTHAPTLFNGGKRDIPGISASTPLHMSIPSSSHSRRTPYRDQQDGAGDGCKRLVGRASACLKDLGRARRSSGGHRAGHIGNMSFRSREEGGGGGDNLTCEWLNTRSDIIMRSYPVCFAALCDSSKRESTGCPQTCP